MNHRCSEILALLFTLCCAVSGQALAGDLSALQPFLKQHCLDCHDAESKKGSLDLTALSTDLNQQPVFDKWVKIHDRVESGEMPPKKKPRPAADDLKSFVGGLSATLTGFEQAIEREQGRATRRRLNRFEYEHTLRDLLSLPELQVKEFLPEDSESHHFNKIGDALDVSHVQMSRYLAAVDYALREAMAPQSAQPKRIQKRYYAWESRGMSGQRTNPVAIRRTLPLIGWELQKDSLGRESAKLPKFTTQDELEKTAVAVAISSYEPTELRYTEFDAPCSGIYKLRFAGKTCWVAPKVDAVGPGRRDEPVSIYADTTPRVLRKLTSFDFKPESSVQEMTVWLHAGETIRVDAARLFRHRPSGKNPLLEADGQPGVVFQWMEVDGPIYDQWPAAGHQLLFDHLPLKDRPAGQPQENRLSPATVDVTSPQPRQDAERLLRAFMEKAYRRPVETADVQRFMKVVEHAMQTQHDFDDSLIAGYSAVLCSPNFLYLQQKPGKLDELALAERLSYFLWNTAPDAELRQLAEQGKLRSPQMLTRQVDRLLDDPKSRRFVDNFVNYWLDLRKIAATAPDATLYPDYQLDDLLVESMIEETQLFVARLIHENLPARNIVSSDFAILNERMATHYGIPGVRGVKFQTFRLPKDSMRGGLMTQASVLKVTANGTTTSPVIRGAWIMERILGTPPPPPPPSVPAVEPDTRGAVTIRQQLDKHRTQEACAVCHTKIDPAGFALESFDTMGAFRDRYRMLDSKDPLPGYGHNGQPFAFDLGLPVDCTGQLPDGREFKDVRQLKALLLKDESQIARNMVRQLAIYATGAPIRFSDRPIVEDIVERSKAGGYGLRTIIHRIVQSPLFQNK